MVAFITRAASWNRQVYDNCDKCYYHVRRHLKLKKYDKNIENLINYAAKEKMSYHLSSEWRNSYLSIFIYRKALFRRILKNVLTHTIMKMERT